MTLFKVAVMGLLSLIIGGLSASTQGTFENQVRGLAAAGQTYLERQGWHLIEGPLTGSLNRNASRTHTFTMVRGGEYLIVGVCDTDCSDVDVKLFDPRGSLLQQDVLVDDAPIVEHKVTRTGLHRIEVVMASCSAAPCYYGVSIYAK